MRTVTYDSVLNGALRLAGELPEDATAEDIAQMAEFVAGRLRMAWEWAAWPDLCPIEKRTFRAVWSAATAYAAGDELYHETEDGYYVALAATTAGQSPTTNPELWEAMTDWARELELDPDFGDVLGTVLRVWEEDPKVNPEAHTVGFTVLDSGVLVGGTANVVWVKHRLREGEWGDWQDYSATVGVAAGAVRRWTDGELYLALAGTTAGENPTSTPAKWQRMQFPHRLALAVKHGALADWLREDGQFDKAGAQEGLWNRALEDQAALLVNQQGQSGRYNRSGAV